MPRKTPETVVTATFWLKGDIVDIIEANAFSVGDTTIRRLQKKLLSWAPQPYDEVAYCVEVHTE